ncbi:hypothetical protein MMC22_004839 [Lobaria immixta]|nr:hypothetical protein [Lobaria immixta]
MANQNQNLFILAADNNPHLLSILRSDHSLASSQDPHGYSVLHAAASYNHLDLLRTLINEFHVDVNTKDEDGETPLFVVETVDAAQVLVDEVGADLKIKNDEGMTAEEKIQTDGEFPTIAAFLRESRLQGNSSNSRTDVMTSNQQSEGPFNDDARPPPLPPHVTVNVGMMDEESAVEDTTVDPEFKERIEALAAREDFQGEDGQRELRELITDAVRGSDDARNDRNVRQRVE